MSLNAVVLKDSNNVLINLHSGYLENERPRSISPIDLKRLNKLLKLSNPNLKKITSEKSSPVDINNNGNTFDDNGFEPIFIIDPATNEDDLEEHLRSVSTILTPSSPSFGGESESQLLTVLP